ncbi:hypothetical protein ACHAW5_004681 [Stephanodiscus triporus]|uniref:Uncharacterized protein n=1 Tax=Stephanodiscus triporus TaxID=2934178 RepID=A0ABD3NP12_9STRA
MASIHSDGLIRWTISDDIDCNSPGNASAFPSHDHHELLSLGETEVTLSSSKLVGATSSLETLLPLLLKWLSVTQPLSTITPSLPDNDSPDTTSSCVPDTNAIIPLPEDVAASHPYGENVQDLVSTLSPSICEESIGNQNTTSLDDDFGSAPPSYHSRKRQGERDSSDALKKRKRDCCHLVLKNMTKGVDLSEEDNGDNGGNDDNRSKTKIKELDHQTSLFDEELIKAVFADPDLCAKIILHPRTGDWIKECVKMLVRRGNADDDVAVTTGPIIPVVMPLSLERLAQKIPWDKIGSDAESQKKLSQFILQLVYALEFLAYQPLSPFVTNARLFPLKESLAYLDSCQNILHSRDEVPGSIRVTLEKLISNQCPDVIHNKQNKDEPLLVSGGRMFNPMEVYESIRDCINGVGHQSGLKAEEIYLLSRSIYPSLDVDIEAVRAILASECSQPKYYSYLALCKDPLVLLKARASVWKLSDVRNILLRILDSLMSANECIAIQNSVTEYVALEYLTARDTIIVRCIVFACASGFVFGECESKSTPHARHCMRCVDMVRSIIAKRQGIIAALIKQGLPENCTDWIVEFVPESFSDAPIIIALLAEKGLLTATERLTIASAGLQVAVVLSPQGEQIGKDLVKTSANVLLESFPLVVGPIGVPVSVLREENGQDVTFVCRKAMFRMLESFSSISPQNIDLKNEAFIALSKISVLCINENNAVGGIPGVAATRRKALLKEIWEKCIQANTALGGAT